MLALCHLDLSKPNLMEPGTDLGLIAVRPVSRMAILGILVIDLVKWLLNF
jgi:hypothetical protein